MVTAAKKRTVRRKTTSAAATTVMSLDTSDAPPKAGTDKGLMSLARDVRSWADFVLGIANTAADLSFRVASSQIGRAHV